MIHSFGTGDGGSVQALADVNLRVETGDFLTIVGPSGCGKTTLLNLGIGLLRPSEGDVLYRGNEVDGPTVSIGYVTQHDSLLPWQTAIQNVMFPLQLQGSIPTENHRELALSWLSRVGLADFADYYPHQLSGGMRQRINIVRSLVYEPEIVFMDEPFGPLDAITRGELQNVLRDLWQQTNRTIVFVTHDLGEAVALGTRVAVMSGRPGTIVDCFDVELPEKRDAFRVQELSEFGPQHNRVRESLFSAMGKASPAEAP